MSARSQALVPLSTEQQAAWRAVAETEKRRHQGNTLAEYPYAGAFFRCLNGSRRISLSDLRFFRHCCKVSDEAAFCLIQRPYISKTLLTRRISPRGSP